MLVRYTRNCRDTNPFNMMNNGIKRLCQWVVILSEFNSLSNAVMAREKFG